jgi:hypothetical protein
MGKLINIQLGKRFTEVVVASFEALSQHLPEETEEYHEKPQSRSLGQDLNLRLPRYESEMLPHSTKTFSLSL